MGWKSGRAQDGSKALELYGKHKAKVALSLMKRLAGQGRAVVMVLHDALWAARACSHVLLLDRAGRAGGRPARPARTVTSARAANSFG